MTDTSLPLTANHWGTYRVRSENGQAVEMLDFERDPDPSPIGRGILDVQTGPTRITEPMVRESWLIDGPGAKTDKRGQEAFVAVSWDEVNRLIADDITRICRDYGNSAIYAGCYGWASAGRFHHAPSQLKRFLNTVGGYTNSFGTYSFAAAEAMVPHILGGCGVPVKNGQIESGALGEHVQTRGLRAAHAAGTHFVNIGPLRSDMMDELGAEWLAPRPSTDTAIMIGLAHTLISENLHDADFLAKYTVGFDRFAAYVMGETDGTPKDADWAAAISELPADTIREGAASGSGIPPKTVSAITSRCSTQVPCRKETNLSPTLSPSPGLPSCWKTPTAPLISMARSELTPIRAWSGGQAAIRFTTTKILTECCARGENLRRSSQTNGVGMRWHGIRILSCPAPHR